MNDKLSVGCRVKLTQDCEDNRHLKKGAVGTLLEEGSAPYVKFDNFTRGHGGGVAYGNNIWAVPIYELELA